MSDKKTEKKKQTLFQAHSIAAMLNERIRRDLEIGKQLYQFQGFHPWVSYQQDVILKKFVDPKATEDMDVMTLTTYCRFFDLNDHIGNINRTVGFPTVRRLSPRTSTQSDRILLKARAVMHHILSEFSWEQYIDRCCHSGGVTIGVGYHDTSQEVKFTFPLTTTREAKDIFELLLADSPKLYAAILSLNGRVSGSPIEYQIVESSRATTVPKTSSEVRMIAIEPTVNMFLQQGLMSYMYESMKEFSLDVELLPTTHKALAHRASLDGFNATIDFRSASDCVAFELVRFLTPNDWFFILDKCRSRYISIDDSIVSLNMFSTMGNATTFPLETLCFYSLAVACQEPESCSMFPEWESYEKVSVFGDDCIVPTSSADLFMQTCGAVGFIVNKEKSFFTDGPGFRESCGGDFLRGSDVRPFYIKAPYNEKLSSLEPWLYTILNQVYSKFISNFGPAKYVYLTNTIDYVVSLFVKHNLEFKFVPTDYPEDSGFRFAFDRQRFLIGHSIRVAPLYANKHGQIRFRYIKFQYPKKEKHFEHLQYILSLRKGIFAESLEKYPVRRRGGYVVARSKPTSIFQLA